MSQYRLTRQTVAKIGVYRYGATSLFITGGALMSAVTTTPQPSGERSVVLHDVRTGRKGMSYDWQAMLIPSATVFEASLQMLLATPVTTTRSRKSRRRS